MSDWISVEDRLPDNSTYIKDTDICHVLATDGKDVTLLLYRHDGGWKDAAGRGVSNVTHWMPVPEPPK